MVAVAAGLALGAGSALADGWTVSSALTQTVAAGTSPTGFGDGSGSGDAYIFFEGAADRQLYELGFTPQTGWAQSAAMTTIGQAAGSTPTSFSYQTDLVRTYFVAASDGAIHELSDNIPGGWAVGGALTPPVAAGTSPTGFAYSEYSAGGARVYFVAASDGAIHELSYETSYGWEVSGALTSAVAAGTSPVGFPYAVTGGVRVYFVGNDGQIHELAFDPLTGWRQSGALTTLGIAQGSGLVAFPYGGAGAVRVYFVAASDRTIHELSYDPGAGWAQSGALTGAVAAGTSPTGQPYSDGVRVYYVGEADDALHQLSYDPSTGWSQSVAMTPAVAAGTSPTSFPWTGCDQRIYFVAASDDAVHELGYNGPVEAECVSDIEPAAPGPSPPASTGGTAPVSITPPARPGHVHVKITIAWRWLRRHTWLERLRFLALPRAASISVTCRGHGCPRRGWSARPGAGRRLERALAGRVLRAGDRLLITITVPGEVAQRAQLVIRDGRPPVASLL